MVANNKEIDLLKLGSRHLNDLIKQTLKKVAKYHPANKYETSEASFGDIRQTWSNLWSIKNPTLRAVRLKVLHKDIWTQNKRFNLGIGNSSACEICGETETVVHQLFSCLNAKRMWEFIGRAIGRNLIASEDGCPKEKLVELMKVSNDFAFEILKSAIFKLLIQIDRSRYLSINQIKGNILYWLRIDVIAINKRIRNNKFLINCYNNIIRQLTQS